MRTEMKIERLRPLVIGHEMDNLTGVIEIDCAAWMTAYPELTRYTLAVAPPEGEPYFTPAGMEGAILRWIVRREDTAMAGEGSYQIIGTGENGEQKSTDFYPLYICRNMPGLDGAPETLPDAALAWVNKVLDAAERAEEAAKRAEEAGGGGSGTPGAPGEDGGYYQPSVSDDGTLSWKASKEGMPAVKAMNIMGPEGPQGEAGQQGPIGVEGAPGKDGNPGKSAYEYAKDGGYTGTEAEFAEKLAKEIPAPYTLPTASSDTKGGVKVGKGLQMDGEVLNAEVTQEDVDKLSEEMAELTANYSLIETITVEQDTQRIIRTNAPDGTPYSFKQLFITFTSPKFTENRRVYVAIGTTWQTDIWVDDRIGYFHEANMINAEGFTSIIRVLNDHGKYLTLFSPPAVNTAIQTLKTSMTIGKDDTLKAVRIFAFSNATDLIPAGTIIEIWGVSA